MSEDFEEKIGEDDLGEGFGIKQGGDDNDIIGADELDADPIEDDTDAFSLKTKTLDPFTESEEQQEEEHDPAFEEYFYGEVEMY